MNIPTNRPANRPKSAFATASSRTAREQLSFTEKTVRRTSSDVE